MKLKLLLVALVMLSSGVIFAQARSVSGTVKDKTSGETLPGVAVQIESTSKGAFTDLEGKYSIQVDNDQAVLVFTLVGYDVQKVTVGSQTTIDISLENTKDLDEVVITALNIPRDKKSVGYATQQVDGSDINTAKEVNVVNALQGKVAGVQITGSSNMGGSSRILIRGAKSMTGNNQPLFVVDGVPVNNANFTTTDQERGALGYDYGNAVQDINPNDIESVQVLKGPAAALYGSRGANGVILITTKKGKMGGGKKAIGVTVNQTYGFDKVFVLPDYQNTYGGGYASGDADGLYASDIFEGLRYSDFSCDCSWGPRMEGQNVLQWYAYDQKYHPELYGKTTPFEAHPDNVKDFFRTGTTSNTNVSLEGGSDRGGFRLSMSNMNQKGVYENAKMNRNTISFSGTQQLSDKLSAGITANYVRTNTKGRPQTGYNNIASNFTQWWQRQLDIEELRDYKNPDGSQRSWNRNSEDDPSPLYWDNPFWVLHENYETDVRERVYGNFNLTYKVNDNLSVVATAMTDFYNDFRQERRAVGSVEAAYYSENRIRYSENNYELKAVYRKRIGNDHDISGFAGMNRLDRNTDQFFAKTNGGLNVPGFYSLDNSISPISIDPYKTRKRINSMFAGLSYGYKGFLYVDATIRNDYSSALAGDNASYVYPSISSSFIFTEIWKIPYMDFGKIRASYGKIGNDTDPYRTEIRPSVGTSFDASGMFYMPNTLNNPNLKNESVYTWEVGAEMNFFMERVHLDVTYYNSTTKDNIFGVAQSAASGSTFRIINAGEMQNKGWEVATQFIPVRTDGGFELGFGLNWARNRNEVVSLYTDEAGNAVESIRLATAPFAVTLEARPGEAYGTIVGYDYTYSNGQKITEDGFYVRTNKVVPLGSVLADYTGGVSMFASYKGFKLYTLFDFQKGGNLFSLSNTWGKYSGTLAETAENNIRENGIVVDGVNLTGYDEAGNPISDGSANTTNVAATDHFFANGGYVVGAADVYDASYIKFRELRLMYDFNPKMLSKTPIRGMTFGVTGRNLAILKKNVPHIDPEAAVSSGNVQGLEGGQLPSTRNISFSLTVKF
jgi:TonB-linked SusC/RagA family outer membrane protein